VLPLVLLALCTSATAQRSAVLSPTYEAVIQRYQSGDREGAVSAMARWPESRLRDEITALGALREEARRALDPSALVLWHRVPVRAALMLHTDCALQTRRVGVSPLLHEWVTAEIARMLRDDGAHRAFARRWYEAMAGLAVSENRWGDGLDWAERGLRDFPDSAETLLLFGAIEETSAALVASRVSEEAFLAPDTRTAGAARLHAQAVRDRLERASRALRSAVAADPALAEARLRLGRVAWQLGEAAEARAALEEALGRNHTPDQAFLAHLFLGRVHEDAGRLDEAARSYEAALALESQAQSARLALSHVRFRQGDAGVARAEAERALRPAGVRLRPDPFWLYPWGPSVGVEDRLEALRREASS
jgi:tetratricopeptide (TPR) repeat protein